MLGLVELYSLCHSLCSLELLVTQQPEGFSGKSNIMGHLLLQGKLKGLATHKT